MRQVTAQGEEIKENICRGIKGNINTRQRTSGRDGNRTFARAGWGGQASDTTRWINEIRILAGKALTSLRTRRINEITAFVRAGWSTLTEPDGELKQDFTRAGRNTLYGALYTR